MYLDTLPPHTHFHFETSRIFSNSHTDILAFIEKDYSIGMHRQEFYEINVVLGNKGMHYIGKHRYPVQRGDAFIIPPLVEHGYIAVDRFDVFHLLISPQFFSKNLAALQKLPAFPILFRLEPLFRLSGAAPVFLKISENALQNLNFHNLMAYSRSTGIEENLIENSETVIFLVKLCALYAKQFSVQQTPDAPLLTSIARIYSEYDRKISVEALAAEAHLSRTAFFKRFSEITGTTPARFIRTIRLDAARNMLTTSTLPLGTVAEKSGFYDLSHFVRAYKQAYGKPPKRE